MNNRLTFKLLLHMFPESMSKLPSFSEINTERFEVSFDVETFLAAEIKESDIDRSDFDINELIKKLKKVDANKANAFIDYAIDFYFSHPQVLNVVQNGRVTLFPNQRVLDDIDFDLLIPVYERG